MSKKIILIIILVLTGLVGVFLFYQGSIFSKEILKVEILGPDKAKAGDEIEYTLKYKNNGNFVLQSPKLVFDLPDNSLIEDSTTRIRQDLPDIYPGDEEFVKIKVRLLGKEGDLRIAKASLSYIPKNLTARYESNTSFITKLEDAPMTLDFDLPSKVEQGKEIQYTINYFSNIDYPLENLSVKVDHIDGFDISSADPKSLDNAEWKLPTLSKAQGGRIVIKGKISATKDQSLKFSAKLGKWENGNFIVIKEKSVDVEVIQPLLYISQQVNGSASYVASPGETLNYKISFTNIGSSPFDDVLIVAQLDGAALDTASITAPEGQVQSNVIIWSSQQIKDLERLGVQEKGEVSFSVKVRSDFNPNSAGANTTITNQVNISQITQKFEVKVNSGLSVAQRAYYKNSDYEISNFGPVPPKVGQKTTYTIIWDIKNYFNDAKNVKVKAILPTNVILTGVILPNDQAPNFSFDSQSREIVWSAGDISAGTGVSGDPTSLYFQVALTPTSAQKGSTAPLIGQVQITGENQFTNTSITSYDSAINTNLPDDFINSGGGVVVQ